MTKYADLEIGLDHQETTQYWVVLRFRRSGSDKIDTDAELTTFDLDHLGELAANAAIHGRALANSLFASQKVKIHFAEARAIAASQHPPVPLRLRLRLSSEAPELHALRWETLRNPHDPDVFLATSENLLVSRYLRIWDEKEVLPPPPKGDLKALVVIANPAGLEGWQLARVDVPGELARAKTGLGGIPVVALCRLAAPNPDCVGWPTLENLLSHLRDGYDILYLVCHGKMIKGVPNVWLENPQGNADMVSAAEEPLPGGGQRPGLMTQLSQLTKLPRLVVLASCQSAGQGGEWASRDEGALSALGPRLAEAGAPAVIAMQGNVTMDTVAAFMPTFFKELRRDGQIDRAMAAARAEVVGRGRPDWWMPVLFMRLESGQLFSERDTNALFMVGQLQDFIPRPVLLQQLVDHLVDNQSNPRVASVALHGFGGFGKTTLARAACHARRVQDAFQDGILWATLGREESQVLKELTRLHTALRGEEQNFGSVDDAARELAQQLAGKRCLLVIDDVWNTTHLQKFLQGGEGCVRLITTRVFGVAITATVRLPVDEMTRDEAVQMLSAQLEPPPADLEPFRVLADRLGHWPLMLELTGATLRQRLARGDGLDGALVYLNQALDEEGVKAFDRRNAVEPNDAITNTISVSLKLLSSEDKERFIDLAIFPQDIDIPLRQVGLLWGLKPFPTQRVCEALSDLSLLKFDLQRGTVRVHAVIRAYLAQQLADPAALHIKLVNTWGDPRRLPDPYAWRWIAYHLAEAAEKTSGTPDGQHTMIERLVQLTTDKNFQTAHLNALKDPASLQRDLERALNIAATDRHEATLPLVLQAASGLVDFRRQTLAPSQVFARARTGDVQAAEQYLGLFAAEREWRQAASLVIAWLAASHNAEEVRTLCARITAQLHEGDSGPLRTLADRVAAVLSKQPWPVQGLPTDLPKDRVDAIIARMAGRKDKLGLPAEGPYEEEPESVFEVSPTASSYEASVRMTADDSLQLVAYAAAHPDEEHTYVEDHLAILAANSYVRYRNRFLWPLLHAVLMHPNPAWAQEFATKVAEAALAANKLEFQEGLPITVLALQARSGKPLARQQLDEYKARVEKHAKTLVPDDSRGDSWGSYTRRLAALTQAYSLLGDQALTAELLALAQKLHFGFAGFQAPAWLTLAETLRVCGGEERDVEATLEAARDSAHNVQEPTFCAQTTARYNALAERWWGMALASLDLADAVQNLCAHPDAPRFAALHRVGEGYHQRGSRGSYTPLPSWAMGATTLRALAVLYGRPLEDFQRLNLGWGANELLPYDAAAWIHVPDPELAPLLASRLAAEVLVGPLLSDQERMALIQSLVPVAAFSPTALDTVLARLLVAAAPIMGPGIPDALAESFGDVAQHLDRLLTADILPPYAGEVQ